MFAILSTDVLPYVANTMVFGKILWFFRPNCGILGYAVIFGANIDFFWGGNP